MNKEILVNTLARISSDLEFIKRDLQTPKFDLVCADIDTIDLLIQILDNEK